MQGKAVSKKLEFMVPRKLGVALLLVLLLALGVVGTAGAAQSSSPNYQVNEVQFGAGSAQNDCSTNYCARESVGDTGVGETCSTNYCAQAGFVTSDKPMLELITTSLTDDMGVLKTNTTGTATMLIQVRDYLSSGYVLKMTGLPMNEGTHELAPLTSPSTSQPGTEQFGINLRANATPHVGADPVQVPSGTFSFGAVEPNYDNPDQFMYQDGDSIAYSNSSTGETDYTVSFIANVSNVTPAGRYNGAFSAVAVPVY